MKTLKDFTPEIQAKIPQYIEKYTKGVFDGGRYKDFNKDNAEALINWNYEKCGYKKPVVLVAGNPREAQLIFNYINLKKEIFLPIIYLIYCIKNNLVLPKEMDGKIKEVHPLIHPFVHPFIRKQPKTFTNTRKIICLPQTSIQMRYWLGGNSLKTNSSWIARLQLTWIAGMSYTLNPGFTPQCFLN